MLVIDNCSQLLKMNYTGSLTRSGMIAETLPELLVVLVAIVLFLVYKSWKGPITYQQVNCKVQINVTN